MQIKYILDANGDPVEAGLIEWASWYEEADRVIAKTDIRKNKKVSTVFLGLDYGFGNGKPVLWETMILSDDADNGWTERYTSKADAIAGHNKIVSEMK